jgi:mRNA interferase RelE/StbE
LSEYRIFETNRFRKDLDGLGSSVEGRIRSTLSARIYPLLKANPRWVPSAARLQNWEPPCWRIRIGSWRIFFEIDDEERVVFLTSVDHRKDAYR